MLNKAYLSYLSLLEESNFSESYQPQPYPKQEASQTDVSGAITHTFPERVL